MHEEGDDERVVRVHTILAVGLVRGPGLAFSSEEAATVRLDTRELKIAKRFHRMVVAARSARVMAHRRSAVGVARRLMRRE